MCLFDIIIISCYNITILKREDIKFSLSIVRQVDDDLLKKLDEEDYEVIFFVDLGFYFFT